MTDSLRTRIAAAIAKSVENNPNGDVSDMADAVIRELQLRKVHRKRVRPNQPDQHRYVTHWERT